MVAPSWAPIPPWEIWHAERDIDLIQVCRRSAFAFPKGFAVPRQFSGSLLRQARRAAGLKPEQLALRIDRSVYSIHQYERGVAAPSTPVLGRLADVLDVKIDDLYNQSEAVADAA